MSNLEKSLRQKVILDIIESKCIGKQEELIIELKECGINVTQATLSRDLHEMNIIRKSFDNHEHRYIVTKEDSFIKNIKENEFCVDKLNLNLKVNSLNKEDTVDNIINQNLINIGVVV